MEMYDKSIVITKLFRTKRNDLTENKTIIH